MPKPYPREQRESATRMALDRLLEYASPYAAAQALRPKLGVGVETLRKWIMQAQVDRSVRTGPSSEELAEIKALKSQVRDLTEANAIALARLSSVFSRFSRFTSAESSDGTPGRAPTSTSACRTHLRTVSASRPRAAP